MVSYQIVTSGMFFVYDRPFNSCLVPQPSGECGAGVGLVLIQTSFVFLWNFEKKYYNSGQNILRHLRKLVAKTHFGKSSHILPLKQAWECCYKFVWLRYKEKKNKKQ